MATARVAYATLRIDKDEDQRAIRAHLEEILESVVFRHSRRYASVFRYIVERTLDGQAEHLKERTIGIEVFGRTPDYDTTTDHAVRSAVAEIRKRLAQYYQDEEHAAPLRIEVQPGSYVPQFRVVSGTELELPTPIAPALGRPTHWRFWAIAATALLLAAGYTALSRTKSPFEAFWQPVFASPNPILICVGNLEQGRAQPESGALTMRQFHRLDSQVVHFFDAVTLSKFAALLQAKAKPYRIQSQTEATFADLQNSPAILIGLLNNDWTERLVGKLRFAVERPAPGKVIIRDRDNPAQDAWSMDYLTPVMNITKDYALVLRVLDPKTDQMVVTAAGISVFGTLAAGEFLTNANEIRKLAAMAPKGWERKNVELVLSTEVIKGKSGRPSIVATHFW